MKYFTDCQTIDQAKNLFRSLCKQLHPDTSGYNSQSDFISMFNEFKAFKPQKDTFNQSETFNAEKFYNIVQMFEGLQGIKITFVGSFIWLEDIETAENYKDGAMYQQKDQIKSILISGYNSARWANKKKSWFFSPLGYKQKFASKKSLEQIKDTWGKQEFTPEQRKRLTNR